MELTSPWDLRDYLFENKVFEDRLKITADKGGPTDARRECGEKTRGRGAREGTM